MLSIVFDYCMRCRQYRYSEFEDLLKEIKEVYSSEARQLKLPGRIHLGRKFDPEFIKGRRVGLNTFIINLMKVHVCFGVHQRHW